LGIEQEMSGKQEQSRRHHQHEHRSNRRRLSFVLALTVIYMLAEAIGGWFANSLALLSDAGHMLTDVAALVLAMVAMLFSARPATESKTYGYYRMEILAALANGAALLAISLFIFYQAFQRIRQPEPVAGFEVLLIAAGGLIVNLISAWLLRTASEHNLNMRAAFLHVLSDALGSVGAIIAGLLIWRWNWSIADPIVSVAVCLLIVYSSWRLISESVNILLEGTPSHINIRSIVESIEQVPGVIDVHDLHVWTIGSRNEALSAHVTIEPGASHKKTLEGLQQRLRSGFNIGHMTIQLETPDEAAALAGKLYQISPRGVAEAPRMRN
jgi:cobalt-zinc-cadmium efflux system protein